MDTGSSNCTVHRCRKINSPEDSIAASSISFTINSFPVLGERKPSAFRTINHAAGRPAPKRCQTTAGLWQSAKLVHETLHWTGFWVRWSVKQTAYKRSYRGVFYSCIEVFSQPPSMCINTWNFFVHRWIHHLPSKCMSSVAAKGWEKRNYQGL